MENCNLCKGDLEEREVEVIKRLDGKVLVIKDVPAWVCKQCGERYYPIDVVEQIDELIRDVKSEKVRLHKIPAGELNYKSIVAET